MYILLINKFRTNVLQYDNTQNDYQYARKCVLFATIGFTVYGLIGYVQVMGELIFTEYSGYVQCMAIALVAITWTPSGSIAFLYVAKCSNFNTTNGYTKIALTEVVEIGPGFGFYTLCRG